MHDFVHEHRAIIHIVIECFFLGVGCFAAWSIWNDCRTAWPRIKELFQDQGDAE